MTDSTTTTNVTNPNPVPVKSYNHDIVGLVQRIQRFVEELAGSSSSGVSGMNVYDQTRLKSYLAAISDYQAWIMANPQLDLPETNRMLWDVKPLVGVPSVENESIQDILRMLHVTCVELLNSQSARMPSGLITFDASRLSAMTSKVGNLLSNYIAKSDPLDLPESSPQVAMTAPGLSGI